MQPHWSHVCIRSEGWCNWTRQGIFENMASTWVFVRWKISYFSWVLCTYSNYIPTARWDVFFLELSFPFAGLFPNYSHTIRLRILNHKNAAGSLLQIDPNLWVRLPLFLGRYVSCSCFDASGDPEMNIMHLPKQKKVEAILGGWNARLEFKNSWHPKCNGWIDHWDNYVTFRECNNIPCRLQSSFFLRFPPIISMHRLSFWQPGPWIFVPPLLFVCPVSQRSVVTGERASSFSVWSGDWDSALFGWAQLAAALQQRSSSSASLQWTIYRRPRFTWCLARLKIKCESLNGSF